MKIGICIDDNAGFSQKEAEDLNIGVVRMPIIIDGKTYFENVDLDPRDFYGGLIDHEVHTSMPSPSDVMGKWREMLKTYDHIIYEPMSSGLSSSLMAAFNLAQDDEFQGKVTVVDNHRISVIAKDAVYDTMYLIKQGKSPEEIKNYLENESVDLKLYIAVDTLKYLVRGGRVTPAGAALGALLQVKPILKIEGGKLDAQAKVIGMRKARIAMINYVLDALTGFFKSTDRNRIYLAVAYTGDIQACIEFRKQVAKAFEWNEEDIVMDPLSLSVGVHIGAGALALTAAVVLDKEGLMQSARKYGRKE